MDKNAAIWVAGHRGLVGSALVRRLRAEGYAHLLLPAREQLDLRRQDAVERFLAAGRPRYVFLAAARVGGILANSARPAEFIAENLAIEVNVIDAARRAGVEKLLFLGSSCIYPKFAPQPIPESALLTGPLEPTNQWYAIAKIAGLMMCQAYRRQYGFGAVSAMPTNLYGPGDNFDLASSHVLPAMIRRFHEARLRGDAEVTLWGTGSPLREFLHVDDLAAACLFLMDHYDGGEPVNIGSGDEVSIAELAGIVRRVTGCPAAIAWDPGKPDGTPRKRLDCSRLQAMGWTRAIPLEDGIRQTYDWYLANAPAPAAG